MDPLIFMLSGAALAAGIMLLLRNKPKPPTRYKFMDPPSMSPDEVVLANLMQGIASGTLQGVEWRIIKEERPDIAMRLCKTKDPRVANRTRRVKFLVEPFETTGDREEVS